MSRTVPMVAGITVSVGLAIGVVVGLADHSLLWAAVALIGSGMIFLVGGLAVMVTIGGASAVKDFLSNRG